MDRAGRLNHLGVGALLLTGLATVTGMQHFDVPIASVSAHFFLRAHDRLRARLRIRLNRLGVGALLPTQDIGWGWVVIVCFVSIASVSAHFFLPKALARRVRPYGQSQSPRCRRTSSYSAEFYLFPFNNQQTVFDRPPPEALQGEPRGIVATNDLWSYALHNQQLAGF